MHAANHPRTQRYGESVWDVDPYQVGAAAGFAAAAALERHPEAVAAYRELGHEIAGHGLRWISYQLVDEPTERAHLAEVVAIPSELTGAAPQGWYTGRETGR